MGPSNDLGFMVLKVACNDHEARGLTYGQNELKEGADR
jgi:hypothetical protein